jgi:hypothetical protein
MMQLRPVLAAISNWPKKLWEMGPPARLKIENFPLTIEYLRFACGGSILLIPITQMTERSNFHSASGGSICKLQYSIPACPA